MNSELIVMTFFREEEAHKAWSALETMRDRRVLGLENVVLMTRDSTGRAAMQQRWELPAHRRGPDSRVPRLLADAVLSGSSEEDVQWLVDAGLDEVFLMEVMSALGPDSSALVVFVPRDSVADTRRLSNALGLFRGTLHHTIFPSTVEAAILERESANGVAPNK